MKNSIEKIFISVCVFVTVFTGVCQSAYGAQSVHFSDKPLEDVRGGPSKGLLELLSLCGIKTHGSWENIIKKTKNWVVSEKDKKNGVWPIPCHCKNMHDFYNALSMLQMTQIVPPCLATYDCAVILGGTLPSLKRRLWFLKQEWERGVRFKHIVFLSGNRELYKNQEDEEDFIDPSFNPYPVSEDWVYNNQLPANEKDVAKFVWDQMLLPKEWRTQVSVTFMAGNKKGKRGDSLQDLLPQWIAKNPDPGLVLFVSSQPFIEFDTFLISKILKGNNLNFDIVGPGFSSAVLDHSWTIGACCSILAEWIEGSRGKQLFFQ